MGTSVSIPIQQTASTNTVTRTPVVLRPNADADVKNSVGGFQTVTITPSNVRTVTLEDADGVDVTATHEVAPRIRTLSGSAELAASATWTIAANAPANGNVRSVSVAVTAGTATVTADAGTGTLVIGQADSYDNLDRSTLSITTSGSGAADLRFVYDMY